MSWSRATAWWSRRRRLEPREWRNGGAVAATALTLLTLASVWWPADTWADSVPASTQVVGTCHAFETEAELDSFSDVKPPVPCTRPHQTETVAVGVLTGDLAAGPERMRPEKRVMVVGDLCREPIRVYTGAGPRDELWRVDATLRLPTAGEWSAGDRRYRCELKPQAGRVPGVSRSLRGVLDTPAGAAYRRCWTDRDAAVPCDERHRAESVSAVAAVPPERRADPPDKFHAWADPVCVATVSEFLGADVATTPYRSVARLIGDGGALECGVAFPVGEPMRAGTLARFGTEPVK